MRASIRFRNSLLAVGVALALGCSADDPNSPTAPTAPVVPPASTVNVTVSSSTPSLEVNGTEPATITVRAARSDTGAPVPNLTQAAVTTTLGGFGSVGGPQEVTLELVNGQATVSFFPGATVGTASLRAAVSTGVGLGSVQIVEAGVPATFFLASVQPNTGSPQGGETVTIHGGGFSDPIRVTINGVPANVQNSTASTIRVTTPPYLAGLDPGETAAVDVSVTIHLNEEGQATDTLNAGFIYANGGGGGTLQPTIFSVTPSSGPNEGGTEVTINGDGFEAPVAVEFMIGSNFASAQLLSVSRTRVVVLTPPVSLITPPPNPASQLASIRITNQSSGRTTTAASAFRYGVTMFISAVAPTQGSVYGGTLVTIYGQGFDEPVAVSLGGVAQQAISVSGTEIVVQTARASACSSAPQTSVTNIETGQTVSGPSFGYLGPNVFSVSPTSGSQAGGIGATLTGLYFGSPIVVTFKAGGVTRPATVSSVTATSISLTVPSMPDSGMSSEPCGGGTGTRYISTSATITVTDPVSGCSDDFEGGFQYNPTDTSCHL